MTTQTDETAPSPAISEMAVEAAARVFWVSETGITPEGPEWPGVLLPLFLDPLRPMVRAALTAALPHLVQAAPLPPDRLDEFAAWFDEEQSGYWIGDADHYHPPMSEIVAYFRPAPASPAPAAPNETLDGVLADIEAMGCRCDDLGSRVTAIDREYEATARLIALGVNFYGLGDSPLSALIALRDAIAAAQQPQEEEGR